MRYFGGKDKETNDPVQDSYKTGRQDQTERAATLQKHIFGKSVRAELK